MQPNQYMTPIQVAPFTGAWIEIMFASAANNLNSVAPFTGAWIEIPPDLILL